MPSACVLGCAGPVLTSEEQALIAEADPWGFILYGRNIDHPAQVRSLTAQLRAAVSRPDAPIFVDQEGGRVQRLGPPHWPRYPAAASYARHGAEIARLAARCMAADLLDVGIDVACAPVLDLRRPGASDVVGDRSFGDDPDLVARLGRAWIDGLLAGGVLPVLKHIPGHGRGAVDSHHALPVVEASLNELDATDFAPFRALADAPMAMTAHVAYRAIDAEEPGTTSATVISQIIRGRIGFQGLLLSDDLGMSALQGDPGERARRAKAAGCDVVIYGEADEDRRAVANGVGSLTGPSGDRARDALRRRRPPEPFDAAEAGARLATLRADAEPRA